MSEQAKCPQCGATDVHIGMMGSSKCHKCGYIVSASLERYRDEAQFIPQTYDDLSQVSATQNLTKPEPKAEAPAYCTHGAPLGSCASYECEQLAKRYPKPKPQADVTAREWLATMRESWDLRSLPKPVDTKEWVELIDATTSALRAAEAKLKEFDEYYTFQNLEKAEREIAELKARPQGVSLLRYVHTDGREEVLDARTLMRERDAALAELREMKARAK